MLRHVVLFRIHDDVPEDRVDDAVAQLSAFEGFTGVTSWRVARSTDGRKGRIIIEDATFEDRDAFERFRVDPSHREAGRRMALIADWWVGDYETAD